MDEQGYITRAEYREARAPAGSASTPATSTRSIHDPFLFDLVQQELIDKLRDQHRPQRRPQGLHDDRPRTCRRRPKTRSTTPATSATRKAARPPASPRSTRTPARSSPSPRPKATPAKSQFNYAWQAHRQPGSSFKTFVLTTAIKQGIDPDTTYYDGTSPMTLADPRRRHLDRQQRRAGRRRDVARQRRPGTRSTSSSPSSTSTSAPKT